MANEPKVTLSLTVEQLGILADAMQLYVDSLEGMEEAGLETPGDVEARHALSALLASAVRHEAGHARVEAQSKAEHRIDFLSPPAEAKAANPRAVAFNKLIDAEINAALRPAVTGPLCEVCEAAPATSTGKVDDIAGPELRLCADCRQTDPRKGE